MKGLVTKVHGWQELRSIEVMETLCEGVMQSCPFPFPFCLSFLLLVDVAVWGYKYSAQWLMDQASGLRGVSGCGVGS